jgi:hypothetical protein
MSSQDDRLTDRAERLLADWPLAEQSDAGWEKRALAIDAAIAAATTAKRGAPSDEELLAAPLPAEPGEDGAEAEPAPMSLAELARQSVADEAKAEDADFARDALSVASQARASQPVIPVSVRAEAARIAIRNKPAEAVPTPSPTLTASAPPTARPPRAPWIAAALMLGGLVIAVSIVWRARQPQDPIAFMPKTADAPAATAAAPKAVAGGGDPEAMTFDQLPGEAEKGAKAAAGSKLPRAAGGAAAVAKAEEPAPAAADPAPPEPKAAAKPKPDEDEKGLKPAASPTDVPQKPSTGAVNAAIGSVLGGARACVAGHKEPSRATLTFGSDGRVQSVAVSGPAGGTGAEGCIRAALSRARVQAFSRPTFSVGVTVRP